VQLLEGCSVEDKGLLVNENSDFDNYFLLLDEMPFQSNSPLLNKLTITKHENFWTN